MFTFVHFFIVKNNGNIKKIMLTPMNLHFFYQRSLCSHGNIRKKSVPIYVNKYLRLYIFAVTIHVFLSYLVYSTVHIENLCICIMHICVLCIVYKSTSNKNVYFCSLTQFMFTFYKNKAVATLYLGF